jgi:hypothetical protein
MDDGLAARDRVLQRRRVADVPTHPLGYPHVPRRLGTTVSTDLGTVPGQLGGHICADESACSRQ